MALRKDLIIKIKDEEVIVPVNYELIEKVERVYGMAAEMAAAIHLVDPMKVQRRMIAQVISLFVQGRTKDLTPSVVTEEVVTSSQKGIALFAGQIQAAVLYSIRGEDGQMLINDEQFDCLATGQDLPEAAEPETPAEVDDKPGKKPEKRQGATSAKPTS